MRDLITGIFGIVLLFAFLAILVFWIKSVPLTIIVVCSVLVMLYDFVTTIREGENDSAT